MMAVPAWCPRCETLVEMEAVASALYVCPLCRNSFTPLELQECAYEEGYEDCLAERAGPARAGRRAKVWGAAW